MAKSIDPADWPASRPPEMIALDKITPHPENPRVHPDGQIVGLGASFDEFGVVMPTVVDENFRLIAGEGRWITAKKNGYAALPCIVVRGWSEKKKLRFMVADNRLPMLAGFDDGLYRAALAQIKDDGVLAAIGFDEASIAEALARENPNLKSPDAEAPAPKKNPIVRRGDLWILGTHRLLCGDATNPADVALALGQDRPLLFLTDPPYGVLFERGQFVGPTKKAKGEVFVQMTNDHLTGDKLRDFIASLINAFGDRDGVFYVWKSFHEGNPIRLGMEAAKVHIQSEIVWSKTPFVLGSADYHWQHETCLYGFKGKNHPWYGGRKQGTVWEIPKPQKMEFHPTQKPIECMKRPIENNTRRGEFVYEPCCGSGTTIIACELTGRRAIALEIEPAYAQVAIERWEKTTGLKALLNGRTLAEVAGARRRKPKKKRATVKAALSENLASES